MGVVVGEVGTVPAPYVVVQEVPYVDLNGTVRTSTGRSEAVPYRSPGF